ncbi:MAG TPA: DUF167 domain-containing protein [Gemmatimonadales bacterium]|nr:DUF167 domain-containing protein [Gemmatimonadales bacterium]
MGTVTVHVVPRGRTTECVGMHGDAVKIRLAAAPVDGAANAELVRYVAERLGVSRSTVEVVAGALARRKIVRVAGVASTVLKSTLLAPEIS